MSGKPNPNPIIKRIRKGHEKFHGGVWKIVYADFVTAMMAFFLLMWVLSSSETADLSGISAYFKNPSVVTEEVEDRVGSTAGVIRGGGQGVLQTPRPDTSGQITDQRGGSGEASKGTESPANAESRRFVEAMNELSQRLKSEPALQGLYSQVLMDVTTEGLRIQIVDDDKRSMFSVGGTEFAPFAVPLLRTIGKVLAELPNRIRVEGHTDGLPYSGSAVGYTNWELSSERANAARRELIRGGLRQEQVAQVVGHADSIPLNPDNLKDPLNRRISVTILRENIYPLMLPRITTPVPSKGQPAPRSEPALSGPPGSVVTVPGASSSGAR